jgi:RNA polymerase sigma-70 factor (ECF subfamily)
MYQVASVPDDSELARRIVTAGARCDADAETELCRRFAPRIRLYGLRHLRNDAAAADLVQDVLLMTLEKLRTGVVRELDKLASFILGTCRQTVIDGRRSGGRRERIEPHGARKRAAGTRRRLDRVDVVVPRICPSVSARCWS